MSSKPKQNTDATINQAGAITAANATPQKNNTANPLNPFAIAIAHVLEYEGGYVNDPRDSGGETNLGISKRAYPNEDIKHMTIERATEIYHKDYWQKCRCDELPPMIAIIVFDTAVNQGTGAAARLLQRSLSIAVDGVIGSNTLAVANKADAATVALDLQAWRIKRYSGSNGALHYLRGWAKRVLALQARIAVMLLPQQEAA